MVVKEGEWISVDGTTGNVFVGKMPMIKPSLEEQKDLLTLLGWADDICAQPGVRKFPEGWPTTGLQVWANADYPKDARRARSYGAKGIGLCRTEHMFFEQERLPFVQRMILAENQKTAQAALDELLPHQRADFEGLFEAMDGYPVIIRLIDPPLHEFLPLTNWKRRSSPRGRYGLYHAGQGRDKGNPRAGNHAPAVEKLHESNPMMGLRGIRLSIVCPDLDEDASTRHL